MISIFPHLYQFSEWSLFALFTHMSAGMHAHTQIFEKMLTEQYPEWAH